MPYEGELAGYEPLRRVANTERIKTLLGRSKVRDNKQSVTHLPKIERASIEPSKYEPSMVIAIDGSTIPVEVETGYPGAEMGYVTVASVFIDLEKARKLDEQRPVNPVEFRKTQSPESIDSAFPGCNVIVDKEISAKSSLRKVLYELMESVRIFEDGESLLDTYEALLAFKPDRNEDKQKCPYYGQYDNNCIDEKQKFRNQKRAYYCHCMYGRPLYSTDALRIHEGMHPDSTNQSVFTEIMQILERLWIVHILRNLEAKGWMAILRKVAMVVDGPLAVFGHPAWLSHAIKMELNRLNEAAKEFTDEQDILIIGIEKTGAFVNHLTQIDYFVPEKKRNIIPEQTAYLLTDDYIKRNIVYSESKRPYGRQTYFGRKFFYKTRSGALLVATLPFLNEAHEDLAQAHPSQFPRLADAMALLDQLVSVQHPNSLSPIITAHAEASIPLNLGKRVLEKMARELMRKM
ncbi:DNA double-strand break repair nuclease NurA [Candidatus Leptofilum sp.]|uniref:DNA double-strand break repair nuclease NurA n=1 Tax=Candidatus Leptofilum sp. TaxID=3241576 RepID=UPI003B5BDEC3